jgi:hypothetical protein
MTNDSNDPIRPEEEPSQKHTNSEAENLQSQDSISELRETLGTEADADKPVRKTGFFSRFTKRLTPPTSPPVDARIQAGTDETVSFSPEKPGPVPMETEDISSAVSRLPAEDEMNEPLSLPYPEVDFSEPASVPGLESSEDAWRESEADISPPAAPIDEESSQWKSFLATLWKPAETSDDQDNLDDETLASRVERSLPFESQAEKEWETPEEPSAFMFDQDPQTDESAVGKKITGSLIFDEGEDIFSEGDGNIWGGLRQELQETAEEASAEEIPDFNTVEEDIPLSNVAFSHWEAEEQENVEIEPGKPFRTEPNKPDDDEVIEDSDVEAYESRPFSEEYAHVFGETTEEGVPPEPEPSVEEIRTIALKDYEEPEVDSAARLAARKSKRWLRTVLILLISIALILLLVMVSMPSIMAWLQPPTPAPVAVVPPTSIPMEGMPYPTGMRMTGGWFFYLQPSTIIEGKWEPETSEWLNGSELRRVVALPWTRQLEAVVGVLVPGDTIELHMSNGDILIYLIQETARIDRNDVSILSSNQPSLALILYQPEAEQRLVVTANMRE